MFPLVAAILIFGSVILMALWEFNPLIKKHVLPKIVDLLSVAEERQTRAPIYLASIKIESEYTILVKSAEKIAYFGFQHIPAFYFKNLLRWINEEATIRIILANESATETLKRTATQLDRRIKIEYRPRIHFKILGTDQRVAIGCANLSAKNTTVFHDLAIISSDPKIVDQVQQYISAFYGESKEYPQPNQIYTFSSEVPLNTESIFVNTSNGLHDIVHGLLSSAKDTVMLMSPFITNDIVEYLLSIIPRDVQVRFITTLNWRNWANQQSDPEALESLLSDRVIIENCPKLNANCIIVDNKAALVSSQNLTTHSWFSSDEAGIFTRNQELINTIIERIESWKPKHRVTMELLDEEIAKFDAFLAKDVEPLAAIPVSEEGEMVPAIDRKEIVAPPLLGFSSLVKPKPLVKSISKHTTSPSSTHVITDPKWIEDIVYVGKKRTIEYVRAAQHQIRRKGSVTIRARGKLIYRAVDVAEQLRMLEDLELIMNQDSIVIETYYPSGKETKWGGISQIAITLYQKN
ncbi:MAG: phospholipase D-like domain-containing protein [Promethearchaeota archaeon]